jgi:hypothetical protein
MRSRFLWDKMDFEILTLVLFNEKDSDFLILFMML